MIEKIARAVTEKFIEYQYISVTEQENYEYAVTMKMETWISLAAIMLIGMYLRVIVSTLFFLVFLFGIKRRSGGFHTKRYLTCFMMTVLTYVVFVIFLSPIMEKKIYVTYIFLVISILVIELIGAVNHPNMNWSAKEYKKSKYMARLVTAMEGVAIAFFTYLGVKKESIVFMAFAVILSAILLLLAKILKQEVSI